MMKITIDGDKAYLSTPYNADFVKRIRNVSGAKWDPTRIAWRIDAAAVDDARAIMRDVYGEDDQTSGKKVKVKLHFSRRTYAYRGSVTIYGKTLSKASSRDSGAWSGEDVSFIAEAPESGGSMKNWASVVPEGAIVILHNVPESMLDQALPEGVTMEIMDAGIDRDALTAEKSRLLARIAEIDKLLEGE